MPRGAKRQIKNGEIKMVVVKLQVPWSTELLDVNYGIRSDDIVDVIRASGSAHVVSGVDLLVTGYFEEVNRVSDVSRYCIVKDRHCVLRHPEDYRVSQDLFLTHHCDIKLPIAGQPIPRAGNVVFLLESPHRDEYQGSNILSPIAPANGKAGNGLDRCLAKVLSRIPCELVHGGHLIISNPIQFQTSLYFIHRRPIEGKWKTLRDNVWRALWSQELIKEHFRARLDAYCHALVINGCTTDLKGYVNEVIGQRVPVYSTPHPASWNDCACIPVERVTVPQ